MGSPGSSPHPVDSAGLVLPEPSWPDQPGSAGVVEPLRRFCNSTNRENSADAWRNPRELADWLAREGYASVGPLDGSALARLVAVREALWLGVSSRDFEALAGEAGSLSVRLQAASGGVALVPAQLGIDAVVGRLVLTVSGAAATGTLSRLRSCHHCQWVFYDTSKNRSGRWCSMAACGGREKARAYRTRRTAATSARGPGQLR